MLCFVTYHEGLQYYSCEFYLSSGFDYDRSFHVEDTPLRVIDINGVKKKYERRQTTCSANMVSKY